MTSKNTQVAQINLQSLLKALVKNANNSVVEGRAFRHKEFQKLIAASQGFQSYAAMKKSDVWINKSNKASMAVTSEPVRNAMIVPGMMVEQFRDGNISLPVTINLENLAICSVSYFEHDYTDLISRAVYYKDADGNDKGAYVVIDPEDDQPIYAINSAEDFEKAMAEKLAFLEGGSTWKINDNICLYGPNGDWFSELECLFSDPSQFSEDGSVDLDCLSHLLNESSFWIMTTIQGYEFYMNCMDLVRARFSEDKKALIVPKEDGDLRIEVLQKATKNGGIQQ